MCHTQKGDWEKLGQTLLSQNWRMLRILGVSPPPPQRNCNDIAHQKIRLTCLYVHLHLLKYTFTDSKSFLPSSLQCPFYASVLQYITIANIYSTVCSLNRPRTDVSLFKFFLESEARRLWRKCYVSKLLNVTYGTTFSLAVRRNSNRWRYAAPRFLLRGRSNRWRLSHKHLRLIPSFWASSVSFIASWFSNTKRWK